MQNGRELDPLAQALAEAGWRVFCPDMPGHGWSQWRADAAQYGFPLYAATVSTMIAIAGSRQLDLFGNSMGSVIALLMASKPGIPLRSLILNDGGTRWPDDAIARFAAAAPSTNDFPDRATAIASVRSLLWDRGDLPDSHWHQIMQYSVRTLDGRFAGRFDPRLRQSIVAAAQNPRDHSWAWAKVTVPTLLIRGERSTMLPADAANEMIERNRNAELVVMPGVGHSPWLRTPDQIDPVVDWLKRR